MARKQVLVQLSEDMVRALDEEAARGDTSRSAILREAAESYLKQRDDARITQAIIDGYTRFPQELDDEDQDWGSLFAEQEQASRELHRLLDEEDRRYGTGPVR